jgi:hypothetical protein
MGAAGRVAHGWLVLALVPMAWCFGPLPGYGTAPGLSLHGIQNRLPDRSCCRSAVLAGPGACRSTGLGGLAMMAKVRDDWGRFEAWAKEEGIQWAKNSLAIFPGGLRGVKATRPIAEGDILIATPDSAVLKTVEPNPKLPRKLEGLLSPRPCPSMCQTPSAQFGMLVRGGDSGSRTRTRTEAQRAMQVRLRARVEGGRVVAAPRPSPVLRARRRAQARGDVQEEGVAGRAPGIHGHPSPLDRRGFAPAPSAAAATAIPSAARPPARTTGPAPAASLRLSARAARAGNRRPLVRAAHRQGEAPARALGRGSPRPDTRPRALQNRRDAPPLAPRPASDAAPRAHPPRGLRAQLHAAVAADNGGIPQADLYLACEMARSRAFSGPFVNKLPKARPAPRAPRPAPLPPVLTGRVSSLLPY